MKKVIKKRLITKRSVRLAAGGAILVAAPAAIAFNGVKLDGGYIGPLPSSWFEDEPCRTEPITFLEDQLIQQWQIDVSAVRDDEDPNTYARCVLTANSQTNTCIAGLADGTVIGCRDDSGPHYLPKDGQILYLDFVKGDIDFCNVNVGTHDMFGEPDPKCRTTGDGDGDGTVGLGCDNTNSTAVVKATGTQFSEGQCYSFNKTAGTLKYGNWSGTSFNVDIEDSSGNLVSASIGSGGFFDVGGVANGTVYFTVDVGGPSSVTAQVDAW